MYKKPVCVKSHLVMMHIRTWQQTDICADSPGLFTQCAAGPGIVRTGKGTSLWGRSGTQEHTVIFVCQKKQKQKSSLGSYMNTQRWHIRGHMHAYTHTETQAENCDMADE